MIVHLKREILPEDLACPDTHSSTPVLPASVTIGASTWNVKLAPLAETEEYWGSCEIANHTILIEKKLSPELQDKVFIHELLHAVCDEGGIPEGQLRIVPSRKIQSLDSAQ